MIRVRQIVLIAGVVASLSALTLGSASAATGKTVDIVGDQDLGAPTPAPHSMTIIDRTEVPQTLECSFCDRFFAAHAPTIGPEGPVPPFVAAVDGLKASA